MKPRALIVALLVLVSGGCGTATVSSEADEVGEEDGISFRAWLRQLDMARDGTGACFAFFLLICLTAAVVSLVAAALILTGVVDL